jgi:hypothetical protein
MAESAPEPPPGRGITLWGATATGKTTFLAALHNALIDEQTGWRLRGGDPASGEALIALTNTLANDGVFPGGTRNIRNINWELAGVIPRAVRERTWYGWRRLDLPVEIPLHLVDAPGEIMDAGRVVGRDITQQFVDNLQNSAGIMFFFDPIREFDQGDAFRHTFGVLAQLDQQMNVRGKLPHHVAVCVTKFDEQRVHDAAAAMQMIEYDEEPPGFPRVPESDARDFFARLCEVSKTNTAHRILPLLEQTFDSRRIRFFVTSAIGFYVDPYSGMFNATDFQQRIEPAEPEEYPRVRGDVRSINVVEPIVWLGRQVARTTGQWTTKA